MNETGPNDANQPGAASTEAGRLPERTPNFFDTRIEFLRGVGPQRAELLNKELSIFTYGDLLQHYPFRFDDRTRFYTISELDESLPAAQVRGRLRDWYTEGEGSKKRVVGTFTDGTGSMSLVWFQGLTWLEKNTPAGGRVCRLRQTAAV